MRRRLAGGLLALAALGLLAANAFALKAEFGDLMVSATATMLPRELPARGGAPVTLTSVIRVHKKDGSTPPQLSKLDFLIDKHSFVTTKGVPTCAPAKLANATPKQARKRCAGALVGTGVGHAVVNLPDQPPRKISSPLSLFNAAPVDGRPSLIAHAYETVPAPKALLVPIVVQRISKGRYGYRIKVEPPPLADGYGTMTLAEARVGRTWTRHGKRVGYLNARCAGGRLQVKGQMFFANGDYFPATFASACHVGG